MNCKFSKTNIQLLFEALVISAIFLSIILIRFRDFFIVDDGMTEMLGYYRQYGKYFLQGIFPFVLDNTFGGTNTLAQFSKSPFTPQAFIVSIFSRFINSPWKDGALLAFLNYLIVSFAVLKTAGLLFKNNIVKFLCIGFVLIQPVTLYQYAGWWNIFNGNTWAIVCFCILVYSVFSGNFSQKVQITLIAAEIILFLSGSVSAIFAVGVVHLTTISFNLYLKNFKKVLDLIFIGLVPTIFFLFIYGDFISYVISDFVEVGKSFINTDLLSVDWKPIFLSFWPTVYPYIKFWGGYQIIPVQWAFTSIYALLGCVIFLQKKKNFRDKFFIVNIIIFFVLCNIPDSMGPIHFMIRILPLFSFLITFYTFLLVDGFLSAGNVLSKNQQTIIYVAVFATFLISFMSEAGVVKHNLVNNLISVLIVLVFTVNIQKINLILHKINLEILAISIPALILILFLYCLKTLGVYNLYSHPYKIDKMKDLDRSYYYLAIDFKEDSPIPLHRMVTGKFLVYDLPAANGYSIAHHRGVNEFFGWGFDHHLFFNREKTLASLFSENKFVHTCNARALNIGNISVFSGSFDNFKESIKKCDYIIKDSVDGFSDIKIKDKVTKRYNSPYIISDSKYDLKMIKNAPNKFSMEVINPLDPVKVVLSRVYWPQYDLYINDIKQKLVYDHSFPFIHFSVPKGMNNKIVLVYTPFFIRYIYILIAVLFLLIFLKITLDRFICNTAKATK